jgi:hypothetical protein
MRAQTTHGEKVADAGMRFAFYGRVSTEDNQDPTLSLPRQLANCERPIAKARAPGRRLGTRRGRRESDPCDPQ